MGKMVKSRYWFTPGELLFEDALAAAKNAFSAGFSVIEIARCFNTDTRSFYNVLAMEKVLPRVPSRLSKVKSLGVHQKLLSAVGKVNLGFNQWCFSHRDLSGQDPACVAKALGANIVKGDLLSEISHLALSRDFNNIYKDIYGRHLSDPVPWPRGRRPDEEYSYIVMQTSNNSESRQYVAHVVGEEDFQTKGGTAVKALCRLQFWQSIKWSIKKLNRLPLRGEGFEEV